MARTSAFQAEGCGFDPRLPLHSNMVFVVVFWSLAIFFKHGGEHMFSSFSNFTKKYQGSISQAISRQINGKSGELADEKKKKIEWLILS